MVNFATVSLIMTNSITVSFITVQVSHITKLNKFKDSYKLKIKINQT